MANVYRRGTKSVHIGTRRSPALGVESIPGCNLDAGGSWLNVQPPGPECEACFGVLQRGSRRRNVPVGRNPVIAAATAGILAAAVVVGSSVDEPVNYFPTSAPVATFSASPVLVTPEPSLALPTETPALTPVPTITPEPTRALPVQTDAPTPRPTLNPTEPPLPGPTCFHPGHNYGVDECRWPHN